MPPISRTPTLHPLHALHARTIQTLTTLLHPLAKRQDQSTSNTNDIIPTHYPASGRNSGAVIGITLGAVAGFLLLCILAYFLRGGRAQGPGPQVTGTEDIVVPSRKGGRDRAARSHRSRSRDRDRDRDGAPRSHRKSHRRSEREMRELSRSPPQRRPSRTIVEERVERVPRGPASRPSRSQIIVDERFDERVRRSSRPPSIRRVDGDDIVEVIEEGSIDEPPRRQQRQRRSSQGYRY